MIPAGMNTTAPNTTGMHTGSVAPRRFDLIEGLRAVAAIAIVFHHASVPSAAMTVGHFSHQFTQLDIGVAIFFVISGFVLYRPFVARHLTDTAEPKVSRFLLRRFARIFPAYWFAFTIIIVVGKATHGRVLGLPVYPAHLSGYVPYYLLIHIYRNINEARGGLNQAWTLATEIVFYLCVPLIAALARKLARRHVGLAAKMRVQLAVLGVLAIASIAFRSYCYWGGVDRLRAIGEYWMPSNFAWFAIGMAFAVWSAGAQLGAAIPRALDAVARFPAVLWALAIIIFATSSNLLSSGILVRPTEYRGLFKFGMHGVVSALLFVPAVFGDRNRSLPARLLRSKPIAYCGLVSYGIYLWHQTLIGQASRWNYETLQQAGAFLPPRAVWLQASFPLIVTFGLSVAIVAATVSWWCVEQPVLRLVDRWSGRHA